jgi:hypothetical protein
LVVEEQVLILQPVQQQAQPLEVLVVAVEMVAKLVKMVVVV